MGTKSSCCKRCITGFEFKDDYILTSKKSIISLIILQSVYRGYIYRKKSKYGTLNPTISGNGLGMVDNFFIQEKKPGIEVSFTTEPQQESNSKIIKLKELLSPFELNEKETFMLKNNYLRRYAILYNDKSLYKGYYNKDWLREGYGVYYLSDGSIYEGFFKDNNMEGRGRLLNSDGFCYEGDFLDNKANGFGKYMSLDGITYIGYWKNEKQHGFGEEIYPDGSRYEGDFENGKKNGKGKFICYDGQQYEGDFLNNDIHGYGTYKWKDGRIFQGNWANNKMEGNGIFAWPDKKRYAGSYKQDNKQGYGVFIWPDNKKYEGLWLNGKQHGYGVFTNNGVCQMGEWKVGKKIRWISNDTDEYKTATDELNKQKRDYNFTDIENNINKTL
jgi:hypothetical protein